MAPRAASSAGTTWSPSLDLTTGLPLVWTRWRADMDEAKTLKHLLHLLFTHWPEVNADAIVADAAWNEKWAAEWCLVNYGLHLIARRPAADQKRHYDLSEYDSKAISRYLGDGSAICRKHGLPMIRDGYEGVSRLKEGLQPGDPTEQRRFRLRYNCPGNPECGRPHLRMNLHWSALAYHPHSLAVGKPDLHAFRLAMLARRNAPEALFSALKVGHKLSLDGAERTRTAKEPTVDLLLSLAMLTRSARVLADQRMEREPFLKVPPPDLAAALGL